jgi:hypothetical protein
MGQSARDRQRMLKLLLGVNLKLVRNIHVLGPFEHLRIGHIGDNGLVFGGKDLH